MNNSICKASEITGKVFAKDLLKFVKAANDRLYMHGEEVPNRESWLDSFVFQLTGVSKKGNVETSAIINVPGYVTNGNTSEKKEYTSTINTYDKWNIYTETFRPTRGFWRLSYTHLSDILELLPGNAEVAFKVGLDYGTNQTCIDATVETKYNGKQEGLHVDYLKLVASYEKRGKKVVREYLLDTSTGLHNSARFGV